MNCLNFFSLTLGLFFIHIGTFATTVEQYLINDAPEEFKVQQEFGDYVTILTINDWPVDQGDAHIFEKRSTAPTKKERPVLKISPEKQVVQLRVNSSGYLPGEPTTFTFKNSKNKIIEEINITPYPILAKSTQDTAQIGAVYNFETNNYTVTLTGFKQDEMLLIKSRSYNEKFEHNETFLNTKQILYLPQVIGKDGGVAKFSVTRPSGETLSLEIPWGLEFLRYVFCYDGQGKAIPCIENPEFIQMDPKAAKYFKKSKSKK